MSPLWRRPAVQGTLALGGVALAIWASETPEEPRGENEVEVFRCAPRRITFRDGTTDVMLEREGDRITVHLGGDAPEEFPGSEDAAELFEAFAPFVAEREVPQINDESMGFADAGELIVECPDARHVFAVGETSFGGRNRYLKTSEGRGLLGGAEIFTSLESPKARLMERRVLRAELEDVVRMELHAGAKTERVAQQNRGDRAAVWTREGDTEHRAPWHEALIRKLFTLRAEAYVAEADGEEVVRATAFGEQGELGSVLVRKTPGAPGEYLVRGDLGWVRLSAASGRALSSDVERAFAEEQDAGVE